MVPHFCLSWALARSFSPLVLASNHWSIFFCEVIALVDVPRLVAQVQHHALAHRLVELVGVDVAAKHLDALLLVRLQQRRAGEADEQRIRQQRLHGLVQVAGLGAVALIHEHMEIALGLEVGGSFLMRLDERLGALLALASSSSLPPNLCTSEQISDSSVPFSLLDQVRRRCWCGRSAR